MRSSGLFFVICLNAFGKVIFVCKVTENYATHYTFYQTRRGSRIWSLEVVGGVFGGIDLLQGREGADVY